jgi:hypothetical protein
MTFQPGPRSAAFGTAGVTSILEPTVGRKHPAGNARTVLLNPFNHRFMPKKTAIDLDVGDTGAIGVRGIDTGVVLRFNAQF